MSEDYKTDDDSHSCSQISSKEKIKTCFHLLYLMLLSLEVTFTERVLFPLYMGAPDTAVALLPVAVESKLPPIQAKKGHRSCSLTIKNVSSLLFISSGRNLDLLHSPSE